MSATVPIFSRLVGEGQPCFVIAEAGLNHNGDLEIAKRLIDIAVVAGADAVKFQKRTVEALAIKSVLDAPDNRFPEFGSTYRQIREHVEFGWDEYVELRDYCSQRGIAFLCTGFDIQAVEFLEKLGLQAYKLASHSLTNLPLLEHVARIGKPVIMSTGMSTLEEIDQAVEPFARHGTPLMLMHCVSAYPTPPEQCNLAMIPFLHKRYNVPVGYSGHELGYIPTLAAVALGAAAVERHYTIDKTMVGFDHKISLEPDEFYQMVRAIRHTQAAIGRADKHVLEAEQITRQKYHVSIASAVDIPAGAVVEAHMLRLTNPGTGLPARELHNVVGRRAAQDIPAETLITWEMLR